MAITDFLLAAAAAAPAAAGENPYGLRQALEEGGVISIATFIILVVMSIGTFYILFTKFLQQQKIINQGKKVRASFWNSANLRDASSKLDDEERLSLDRRGCAHRPGPARQADRPGRPA